MTQIISYNLGDQEEVLLLLANACFKRRLMAWQFTNCTKRMPVAAKTENQIVGFNGIMPVTVQLHGENIDAAWSCDFIVNPMFQRQGIGLALKQKLDDEWPLLMALGVSKVGQKVLKRSGWKASKGPRRYTRIFVAYRWRDKFFLYLQKLVGRLITSESSSAGVDFVAEINDTLPPKEEIDTLWATVKGNYVASVVRDWAYLQWRYADAPYKNYQYFQIKKANQLVALGVLTRVGKQLTLVDYLGPRRNRGIKTFLIGKIVNSANNVDRINCTTSDKEFSNVLLRQGFLPSSTGHLEFFVRDNRHEPNTPLDWFLMGGDSDTEMLDQARAKWGQLDVSVWSESEFLASRTEWDNLCMCANGDPLFMSWLWQSLWWTHFGPENDLHLHIIAVRNSQNKLIALAPFCQRNLNVHGVSTIRLEALGNLWQGPQTMRSEYIEPLIDPDWLEPASSAIADSLLRLDEVDELIIHDCPINSRSAGRIVSKLQNRWFVRKMVRLGEDETRYALLPNDMSKFLSELGPNTRRRLYGRRRLVETTGNVKTAEASASNLALFFEDLNRFHVHRWGQPVFEDRRLAFHMELASELLKSGRLKLSRLTVGEKTISILYDIVAGEREYNLQMGFDQDFLKGKLSPGILHLGFAIEEAILEGRKEFDLLAGFGKTEQYKNRLTNCGVQLCTWQAIQPKLRQLAYAVRELCLSR